MANEQRQQPRQGNPSPAPTTSMANSGPVSSPRPEEASRSNPVMPDGKPMPTRKGWEEMTQEYLWDKGWKPSGYDHDNQVLWEDPLGSNDPGERKLSHVTKDEGGNEVKVTQYYAPPIPWSHRTADAYGIQMAREQHERDAPKRAAEAQAKEDRKQEYQRLLAAKRAQRMGVLANK